MEVWRDIKGYEGLYQVSNLGDVKRIKGERCYYDRIIKQKKSWSGHMYVMLSKDGIRKNLRVHRLVADSFIPNPNNYPIINHRDENPSNNNVDNLEWCTQKYNMNYGTIIQRARENNPQCIKCKIDDTIYLSIGEAARALGINYIVLCNRLKKGEEKYKGHSISYVS